MTVNEILVLARKHVKKGKAKTSANLCLQDAEKLYASGDYDHARERAIKSLEYSVGCFHADYQKVVFAGK